MCAGEFGGPSGARRYIWHLRETGCGTYYGHSAKGTLAFAMWLWHMTGREREYLESIGQPIPLSEWEWHPDAD